MKIYNKVLLFFMLVFTLGACKVQLNPIEILTFEQQLQQLFPTAEISKVAVRDHFKRAYQLVLNQPLDHQNSAAGTFKQYIYISHYDFEKPTVFITEGYNATHYTYELSEILKSNQVMVEYRFYGKSRPNPIPWEYLTNDQAIADYHSILTKLKTLYHGKFISTGISKGGETVLIYKSKYPDDVDVAVPYVAPLINTQEDPKTEEHIKTVGTTECRAKITNFQRLVLKNRDSVLKEIEAYSTLKDIKFTEVPMEEALEYAVLEYPFSFWQWGGKCDAIPDESTSVEELFNHLNSTVGINFYSDKTYFDLLPSYYQHMTELGYYGFDTTPVKDLLKVVHEPTNLRFAPKNVDVTYNPNYIKKVREYVENKGDHILYIYGEYDTWGACAPTPKPHVDALKMVLKGAPHSTRVKHFSKEDQDVMYAKLRKWLGFNLEIYPMYNLEEE